MHAHTIPPDFVALGLEVPPMLEAALGYEGPARWVGFFWQYDDARAHDGRFDLPADWYAWRVFTEHLTVMAVLAPFDFGGGIEGTHMLLLDRADRRLYAVATATALPFLAAQWMPAGELPAAELRQLTELPDLDLVTEVSRFQAMPVTPAIAAEVSSRMQRAAANYAALASWLAEHLPKPDPTVVRAMMEQTLAALLGRYEERGERWQRSVDRADLPDTAHCSTLRTRRHSFQETPSICGKHSTTAT